MDIGTLIKFKDGIEDNMAKGRGEWCLLLKLNTTLAVAVYDLEKDNSMLAITELKLNKYFQELESDDELVDEQKSLKGYKELRVEKNHEAGVEEEKCSCDICAKSLKQKESFKFHVGTQLRPKILVETKVHPWSNCGKHFLMKEGA